MTGWPQLDRFLRTDPRDVGCAEAMDLLHVYAELVAAGEPAEQRYPGIVAHLRACGPCGGISRACWPRSATTRPAEPSHSFRGNEVRRRAVTAANRT